MKRTFYILLQSRHNDKYLYRVLDSKNTVNMYICLSIYFVEFRQRAPLSTKTKAACICSELHNNATIIKKKFVCYAKCKQSLIMS